MRGMMSSFGCRYRLFYRRNSFVAGGLGILLFNLVVLLVVEGYSFSPRGAYWLRSNGPSKNNMPNPYRTHVRPNLFRFDDKESSYSCAIYSKRSFDSPTAFPDSGATMMEAKEVPNFDEEIFKLFHQSNSSLYLPKFDADPQKLQQTQEPQQELIDVDQAFYRVINEMILNDEKNISTEAILNRIVALQNDNGTVAYPLRKDEEDIENDPEYGPIFTQIMQSFQKPFNAMKEWIQGSDNRLSPKLHSWRQHVVEGIDYFKQHELTLAKESFNAAAALQVNQTMQQRGMLLYCLGEYDQAVEQFLRDIKHLEKDKLFKISDLRLWASACYNRLGDKENALKILDVDNLQGFNLIDETPLMNMTMQFYANRLPISDMVEFLSESVNMEDDDDYDDEEDSEERENSENDDYDEDDEDDQMIAEDAVDDNLMDQVYEKYKDVDGSYFYGNFYTALYYDSIQEEDMMKAFLEYPANSNRYPPTDLWFHLPRILYDTRSVQKNKEKDEIDD